MSSRKQRIHNVISQELTPSFLSVDNESHKHHAGAETHFKLVIVSEKFQNLAKIARHRLLNHLLADELAKGLHALSLHLYSPDEWQICNETVLNTPACRGGYRHG